MKLPHVIVHKTITSQHYSLRPWRWSHVFLQNVGTLPKWHKVQESRRPLYIFTSPITSNLSWLELCNEVSLLIPLKSKPEHGDGVCVCVCTDYCEFRVFQLCDPLYQKMRATELPKETTAEWSGCYCQLIIIMSLPSIMQKKNVTDISLFLF